MSVKILEVSGVGTVRLQKRRGTRNLRISLNADGSIRVSLPPWVPYRLGIEFVQNKQEWIARHRKMPSLLQPNHVIGKAHRLMFLPSQTATRASGRLVGNEVRVTYPLAWDTTVTNVQHAAQRGAIKALQQEAEQLLPPRLRQLAQQYGYSYRSVRIKHLRSKWGSCDNTKAITLNSFLMTLPWPLIDYVLLHELAHTKVLRHGHPFWQEMARHRQNVDALRKELRSHQPTFSVL